MYVQENLFRGLHSMPRYQKQLQVSQFPLAPCARVVTLGCLLYCHVSKVNVVVRHILRADRKPMVREPPKSGTIQVHGEWVIRKYQAVDSHVELLSAY